MKYMTVLFFSIIPLVLFGQYQFDNIWLNGTRTVIRGDTLTDPDYSQTMLNFNQNKKTRIDADFSWRGANVSFSDHNGELLFLSNGCLLYDSDFRPVPNSDRLTDNATYGNFCDPFSGGIAYDRGIIALPFLSPSERVSRIKLLSYGQTEDTLTGRLVIGNIAYTDLDINDEGDLNIGSKYNVVYGGQLNFQSIAAVKHANNRDWWVFSLKSNSNQYVRLLVTQDSVELYPYISIGDTVPYGRSSRITFSPDGSKFALTDLFLDGFAVFDFDRSSGALSSYKKIEIEEDSLTIPGLGIEFSSNNQFLYISTAGRIYQYDTHSEDILSTQEIIATWDGSSIGDVQQAFGNLQRGPDCRIYVSTIQPGQVYHVIQHPNRRGLDTEFLQARDGVELFGWNNGGSIPYQPNYRLGTPYPTCDSLLAIPTSIRELFAPEAASPLEVFPNPTEGTLFLEQPSLLSFTDEVRLEIIGLLGNAVWSAPLQPAHELFASGSARLDLSAYAPGIYHVRLTSSSGRVWLGKVVKIAQ